jgi:hypothetical protein
VVRIFFVKVSLFFIPFIRILYIACWVVSLPANEVTRLASSLGPYSWRQCLIVMCDALFLFCRDMWLVSLMTFFRNYQAVAILMMKLQYRKWSASCLFFSFRAIIAHAVNLKPFFLFLLVDLLLTWNPSPFSVALFAPALVTPACPFLSHCQTSHSLVICFGYKIWLRKCFKHLK